MAWGTAQQLAEDFNMKLSGVEYLAKGHIPGLLAIETPTHPK